MSRGPASKPIESEKAYVQVRLAEMYLGAMRRLWRKYSPLMHAFVTSADGKEQHNIAGPGQLQDLGGSNLDRVLVLNQRLVGPIPYRGEELEILTGLYSVPREDTAAALVSTVSTLSSLIDPTAVAGSEILKVVKTGVDSILGLGDTTLRLGVNDTFSAGKPLRSGFLIGIAAPAEDVDSAALWVKDGQLKHGNNLVLADPYQDHDYLVVEIERLERRIDWPGLPGLDQYQSRFSTILKSSDDKDILYRELKALWPEFREALNDSPFLTRHDAGEIATDMEVDLKSRVEAIATDNPFEPRSWESARRTERLDPHDVDFTAVPEATAEEQAGASTRAGIDPF